MMPSNLRSSIHAFVLLMALVPVTLAAPIISIDMDPTTPGIIDAALVVPLGATFTVDVVVTDDGLAPATFFDTVWLGTSYNGIVGGGPTGPILGPGPTGHLAGLLASPPFIISTAADNATSFPVFGGLPLTAVPGLALPPDFASSYGDAGLYNPSAFGFLVPPGPPTAIFSIDFTALAPGTSDILAHGSPLGLELTLGFPPPGGGPGVGGVGFGGPTPPALLIPGTVTVTAPIPEPTSGTLLLAGLGALLAWRRRSS